MRSCMLSSLPALTTKIKPGDRRSSRFQSDSVSSFPEKRQVMNKPKTVLITGAAGNLGAKLRQHLEGRYRLILLDIDPRGDGEIVQADLSTWTKSWLDLFQGVDAVVHFAADPTAFQTWPKLIAPNLDVLVNVYQASAQVGVKRMIYASSNHVMGGYQNV